MKKFILGLFIGALICFLLSQGCEAKKEIVYVEKPIEVIKEVLTPSKPIEVIKYKTKVVVKKEYIACEEMVLESEEVTQDPTQYFEDKKNNISLLIGHGPRGMNREDISATQVGVETKYDIIFGLLYQREFNKFNVGIGGFNNKTIFTSIGKDF